VSARLDGEVAAIAARMPAQQRRTLRAALQAFAETGGQPPAGDSGRQVPSLTEIEPGPAARV
jgi:hypothetical protein